MWPICFPAMKLLTTLEPYEDDRGNRIDFEGRVETHVRVKFVGSNNTLRVAAQQHIAHLVIDFDCDNGLVEIGPSKGVPALRAAIRVGDRSRVLLGSNVSSTTTVAMSAAEGTTIRIGDDVMIASNVQIRADDGHPIFDVHTGRRVNVSRSITVGNHVWLGFESCVLGGAAIGDGSVVGMRSIVTRSLPNNVVAAGVPAKVVRKDIAWERPHLTLVKPYHKPHSRSVKKSAYWATTVDATEAVDPADTDAAPELPRISNRRRAKRRLRAALRRARAAMTVLS